MSYFIKFSLLLSIFTSIYAFRVPVPGSTWQWQLSGNLDTSFDVCNYDIDLFDNDSDAIQSLSDTGKMVICYFSAGSYENWRPDKDSFPDSILGNNLSGWPGERYLDIRQLDTLSEIMGARMDLAVQKGCHAIEPDNIDSYNANTGFSLSANDQLQYNQLLAQLAHERNLSIALKNDLEQADTLEPYFDFAINEECNRYNECHLLEPFVMSGKAVLHCEYNRRFDPCEDSPVGFSSIRKSINLTANPFNYCPNNTPCSSGDLPDEPPTCVPIPCVPQPCVLEPMDVSISAHLVPCVDDPQTYCT